ncbi:MAG: hypothetical protein R3200_15610 [Xanthomonadales bacterium]|nr:hypothetical protein [Xanthomonadales bacterium]
MSLAPWILLATLLALPNEVERTPDGERTLVVVASAASRAETLSPSEVRLSYLAVPVELDGSPVRPVLNQSDELLFEVFLQKVMFLSADHYRRQLVARVFQSGGARPPVVRELGEVVSMLEEDPRRISYMWQSDAAELAGLKTIAVLWHGNPQ